MLQLESVSHLYSFHSYEKNLVRIIVPKNLSQPTETKNQFADSAYSDDKSAYSDDKSAYSDDKSADSDNKSAYSPDNKADSSDNKADSRDSTNGYSIRALNSTALVYQNQLNSRDFPDTFADFNEACLERLLQYNADIYLVGTGESAKFPDRSIHQHIYTRKLAIDFMDTGAACRTYNILTAEERKVAALIFIDGN